MDHVCLGRNQDVWPRRRTSVVRASTAQYGKRWACKMDWIHRTMFCLQLILSIIWFILLTMAGRLPWRAGWRTSSLRYSLARREPRERLEIYSKRTHV
ncbi:hypothetical protein N658DRAFT_148064 [Parathielavia hyrcaniae]|uniref:Uncharacterized protein n=1 Tax=Parathielavia hyrcaniae TaxID=113614 RepID=A0AAN6PZC5_9PEZI|nr:hypothetical protein N658DRAFT_148064 [Parathielavia hyrcaniae]